MTEGAEPRRNGAARMLRAMLAAQCALALVVVATDLPADIFGGFAGSGPRAPAPDVPVSPGNQTRQFDPARLYTDKLPPGAPAGENMPSRLLFTTATVGGRADGVALTGQIAEGDARRLGDWLRALPRPPSVIALHSPGGVVDEALQIGRMAREMEVAVVVEAGAICFSACPYILAGGAVREVSRAAHVGVHQHYFGENTYLPAFLMVSDIQAGQGAVMDYLGEMGIDPMLMAKALVTPPDDIYILLPEELERFGLATAITE